MVAFVLASVAPLVPAWAATSSLYTSIAEEDCARSPEVLLEGETIRPAEGEALFRCPGPPGHALYIFDDGTRSWYALEREGEVHSLKNDIIQDFRYGQFPNVPTSGVVEWRTTDGESIAGLIFRISYQEQLESGLAPASVLFVYNLQDDMPHFVGSVESNDEARRLLDASIQ